MTGERGRLLAGLMVTGVLIAACGRGAPASDGTTTTTTASTAPVGPATAVDPAAVTTGGRSPDTLAEMRERHGDTGDETLPLNFLSGYIESHGDDYAGFTTSGGPSGPTSAVVYVLASDPVVSPDLQEGIDLARDRGLTVTIEERELSYNALWGIAGEIADDPSWRPAVIQFGIDVAEGEAAVGLDARLDPAERAAIAAEITARYAPHVRVDESFPAFSGGGGMEPQDPTG